jgi:hypothetical protein
VRTPIAILLSLLFLVFSGLLVNGIEARADFNDEAEEEASAIDDLVLCFRPNLSVRLRTQRARPSVPLRCGLPARQDDASSRATTKNARGFSQQDLYRFQEVYRL